MAGSPRESGPGRAAVSHFGVGDLDRADVGGNLARRAIAVPDHPGAAIRQLLLRRCLRKRLQFDLNRPGEQLPASAQNFCQWIINLGRLTKRQDVGRLVRGVSLSLRGSGRLDTRLDTPPLSTHHHPLSRIAPPPEVVSQEGFVDVLRTQVVLVDLKARWAMTGATVQDPCLLSDSAKCIGASIERIVQGLHHR
ncbi:hypothetical protein ACVIHI_000018 [Bradyrhizobium sp. USDA 4524]|nr:hypothetical protein [Bradyrhizobium sp. USDA 4538]MCP1899185.1 hypothetical protein [Bradyrhizobium sp. USDA 4537]MCP1986703.1 hypothetical protein [Bradyrhizobium sp. USDA 4539]